MIKFCLIPKSSWKKNLRHKFSRAWWDKTRHAVYQSNNLKCLYCGKACRLDAHEQWEFNDVLKLQTLVDIIPLCGMCHKSVHIVLTKSLCDKGACYWDAIVSHYCKVNMVSEEQFQIEYREAIAVYEERSKWTWYIDYGKWKFGTN